MPSKLMLVCAVAVSLIGTGSTRPSDTLIVVGVAVDEQGRRLPGIAVTLLAGAAGLGLLAEDRTSATGVFSLHAQNLAGPIPELAVVHESESAVAKPVRVKVGGSKNGLYDVRAADLRVLPLVQALFGPASPGRSGSPIGGTPTTDGGSALRYAALAETQDAFVLAGLKTPEQATADLQAASLRIRSMSGRGAPGNEDLTRLLKDVDLKALDRDVIVRVLSGRGGGGPRSPRNE